MPFTVIFLFATGVFIPMYLSDYEVNLHAIQSVTSHPLLLLPLLEALLRAKQETPQKGVILLLSLRVLRGLVMHTATWELPWSHTLLLLGLLVTVSKAASLFEDVGGVSPIIRGLITLSALLLRIVPAGEAREDGEEAAEEDGGGAGDRTAEGGAMAEAEAAAGMATAAGLRGEGSIEGTGVAAPAAVGVAVCSGDVRKGIHDQQQQQEGVVASAGVVTQVAKVAVAREVTQEAAGAVPIRVTREEAGVAAARVTQEAAGAADAVVPKGRATVVVTQEAAAAALVTQEVAAAAAVVTQEDAGSTAARVRRQETAGAVAGDKSQDSGDIKQGRDQGEKRQQQTKERQKGMSIPRAIEAAAAAASAPGGVAAAPAISAGPGSIGSSGGSLVPEPSLEDQQQAIAYVSCHLLATATKVITKIAWRETMRLAAKRSVGGSAVEVGATGLRTHHHHHHHQQQQQQGEEAKKKGQGKEGVVSPLQHQELPEMEKNHVTSPPSYRNQQEEQKQREQKQQQREPHYLHQQQQQGEPHHHHHQQQQQQGVHRDPHHRHEQGLCHCCGKDSTELMTVPVKGLIHMTVAVLNGLQKLMYWPATPGCIFCSESTPDKSSSDSRCLCNSSSTTWDDKKYPLGWSGANVQTWELVMVPFSLLSFLASELHTLVTETVSRELRIRVALQMGDVDWMCGAVSGEAATLLTWWRNGGHLCPKEMWGGEWLRVPHVVSRSLLMAVAVDFACNNPDCTCLDGPWELGLVSHRAEVVCGGCGVARYCSRGCQKKHWKWHALTCKDLQQQGFKAVAAAGGAKTKRRLRSKQVGKTG
jgi:hypothetical protein